MKKIGFNASFIIACAFASLFNIEGRAQGKDLRPLFDKYGITIKNQGGRGTCSVFAVTGLIEFERANVLNDATPLSVEIWNLCRRLPAICHTLFRKERTIGRSQTRSSSPQNRETGMDKAVGSQYGHHCRATTADTAVIG